MGDAVNDTKKTTQDVNKGYAAAQYGATQDMQKFGKTAAALSFGTDSTSQALMGMQAQANRNTAQGIKSQQDVEKQRNSVEAQQKERQASQARDAAEAQKSMQEFGQAIMNILGPIVNLLTPAVNALAKGISLVAKGFDQLPGVLQATIAAFVAYKLFMAKQAAGGGPGGGSMYDLAGGAGKKLGGALGRIGGGVKGLGLGMAGGLAGSYAADALGRDTTAGKTADVLGQAAGWAGTGAMLGSIIPGLGTVAGGAIGGVLGAGYGAYQNFFGGPKMANGGVVTQATSITAGESGSEAIVPLYHLESLKTEMQTLNKQTTDMLRYLKEISDQSQRNVDATKALSGDLFKF